MPEPVELLEGAVKHEDTIEFSWRFKANLSDLPPEGITLDAPAPVPLPGKWSLKLCNDKENPDNLKLHLLYGRLPVGIFGKSVAFKSSFV